MELNRIHFIHANGFPPNAYQTLFNNIKDTLAPECFVLNKNNYNITDIEDWTPFHNNFIESIKNHKNIIGLGHSIGGNLILRSALTHPEKFSKLILLDPTLFIPRIIYGWILFSKLGLQGTFHPWMNNTLNKKMIYNNHEEIFKSYRRKMVFSNLDDNSLNLYIKSITEKIENKLHITYSKEWEYHIYKTGLISDMYIWRNIKNLKVPCLIIRAEESNAFLDSSKKKISKLNPKIKFHTIENSTHLFPLEYPKETATVINNFI